MFDLYSGENTNKVIEWYFLMQHIHGLDVRQKNIKQSFPLLIINILYVLCEYMA